MVSVVWEPTSDLDFNLGIGVSPNIFYDPVTVTIEVAYVPVQDIGVSFQFDAFQANGAIALVRSRNLDGTAALAGDVNYAYMPGATFGQIGTLPGGGGQRNISFADGSILLVGDGTLDTAADDLGNDLSGFATWQGSIHAYGLGGPDVLHGGAFRDRLLGNTGADRIYGGEAGDWAYGGRDNDWIYGEGGDDQLFGDLGLDWVIGGVGADTMFGGADNDTLDPGEGNDWGFGGKGSDHYDLIGLAGIKNLFGDDDDDVFDLSGNLGDFKLFGGNGNEEFLVDGHLGQIEIDGGSGDNTYDISGLALGGTFWGGDDRDFFDLSLQHAGSSLPSYRISLGGGDDRVAIVGIAEGIIFDQFETGGGRDLVDLRAGFFFDRNLYSTGDDADTVHGAANGGIYDLGLGMDHFFGSGGHDEIRVNDDWRSGLSYELHDWSLGVDKLRLDRQFFDGIGDIHGYRGNGLNAADPQLNFFIANDDEYTFADYIEDFVDRLDLDLDEPFFAMFFNGAVGAIELWYVVQLAAIEAVLLVSMPGLVLSDLDLVSLSGPSADLDVF